MKKLIYGGTLTAILLASLTVLWPFQMGLSQDSDEGFESCPSCNGGRSYHHNHYVYVNCTIDDSEDDSENVFPPSDGSSEQIKHLHHTHYVCR